MFYSQFILAKKGPLGTIWIAAHLERKLRKNQVADTDIGVSVDSILSPDVPIALRLSSHLLLGVVRIYSRKVNYLFDDCSEALLKVKQAFRSTAVDLPPEESTAPYHSITLPETFDLDDFELPDNEIFQGNFVDHHVSTRDQITLQDTLDNVGYSTSQFGLDERFGDGDTSQIGLDLEEELFSDKREDSMHEGDPGAAHDPSTKLEVPDKGTENIDGMENSELFQLDYDNKQIDANAESMNYAQAPCTPGLVEPNLSSAQEGLACDDHIEPEDHNLIEPMEIDSMEVKLTKSDHQAHSDEVIHSSHNDPNQATVHNVPFGDGQILDDMEMHEASARDLPSDAINGDLNGPDPVEESLGGGKSMDDENSGKPEGRADFEAAASVEDSSAAHKSTASNELCVIESSKTCGSDPEAHQDPKDLNGLDTIDHEGMPSVSLLQPCQSHLNQAAQSSELGGNSDLIDLPSETSRREDMGGNNAPSTDNMKPSVEENLISEPTSGEVQLNNSKTSGQSDNVNSSDDRLENQNDSPDLPAPEKLLSVPETSAGPNNFLVESTPNKEVPDGVDGDGAGMTQISGRKRSLTESTLTVQSLNSVESFEVNGLKRTAESIPEDDDLLSSILVGRRSSVLKLRPTPPAPEVVSLKRPRAPRPSTSKRKVHMDDTMVLHGDTIRQQLVNTEDIRRLRKKAPCTRSEILLIQRQFLEDDIFNQPIFTGMSADLLSLHCESHDVSRIKVDENVESISSSELGVGMESSLRQNVTEGTEKLSSQHIDEKIGEEIQPVEMPLDVNQQDGKQESCSHGTDVTPEGASEPKSLENEMVDIVREMETDRVNIAVDSNNHPDLHGHDPSFTPDPASGDTCNLPTGDIDSALLNKTEINGRSGQVDGACMSPDMKLDSIDNDISAVGIINNEESDSVKRTIDNVDTRAKVRMDSSVVDESSQDNKDGASADLETGVLRDHCASTGEDNASLANVPQETGGCDHLGFVNNDQSVDDLREMVLVDANTDEFDTHLLCQNQNPSASPKCGQEFNMDSKTEHVDVNNDFVNGEYEGLEKADLQIPVDAEGTGVDHLVHENYHDMENFAVENDTDFLNVDDDEMAEEGDGDMAIDETHLDNSGWSSRTRAVAKYLQIVLDKEASHGRKAISMDSLLTGKTRKEASRMFFETLVLKTKDYIHVEQAKPFDNITIKPQMKLMKSAF